MTIPYHIKFQNPSGDDLIVVTGDENIGFTRTVVIPDTVDFINQLGIMSILIMLLLFRKLLIL